MSSPFAPDASVNAQAGRNTILYVANPNNISPPAYTAVAGLRQTDITKSDRSVDMTNSLSQGNYEALADGGVAKRSFSLSGVYNTNNDAFTWISNAYDTGTVIQIKVLYQGTNESYEGWAVVQDFSIPSPYDNIVTFSVTVTFTGAVIHTPPSA